MLTQHSSDDDRASAACLHYTASSGRRSQGQEPRTGAMSVSRTGTRADDARLLYEQGGCAVHQGALRAQPQWRQQRRRSNAVFHYHTTTILLLLCFFAPLARATVALSQSGVQYSYTLCLADAVCTRHFSLQQPAGNAQTTATSEFAQALFEEILPVALARRAGSLDDAVQVVEHCVTANRSVADSADAVACAYVDTMWQGVMRDLSACAHPNQVWISGHGCVCDTGKHCSDDCLGVVLSDLWSFVVALVLVAIGMLVGFAWINMHLRTLTLFVTQLSDAFASELYYNQGIYYLYNLLRGNYTPAPTNSATTVPQSLRAAAATATADNSGLYL